MRPTRDGNGLPQGRAKRMPPQARHRRRTRLIATIPPAVLPADEMLYVRTGTGVVAPRR
ncbi:hypothetical protein [Actinoallomurus sp. NPDC050550]|uniref:hypothetical protein n=1 Tax=Actinoallomurus sp. NPDC050550 TaxID=3154937 RepID=UPI0033FB4888